MPSPFAISFRARPLLFHWLSPRSVPTHRDTPFLPGFGLEMKDPAERS